MELKSIKTNDSNADIVDHLFKNKFNQLNNKSTVKGGDMISNDKNQSLEEENQGINDSNSSVVYNGIEQMYSCLFL